eukprot:TRINITY_DN7453_c0_g4_i1.p1 TRINITY_DN7453_c0_g4~~TRINITY_DN7453_c0_g4_i1.p1  ORF type:complete len:115 (+),score=5.65 TRINITY_DN7453_c0_g4_i1:143-487(+)
MHAAGGGGQVTCTLLDMKAPLVTSAQSPSGMQQIYLASQQIPGTEKKKKNPSDVKFTTFIAPSTLSPPHHEISPPDRHRAVSQPVEEELPQKCSPHLHRPTFVPFCVTIPACNM